MNNPQSSPPPSSSLADSADVSSVNNAPATPQLDDYAHFHGMLCRYGTAARCVASFRNGTVLFLPSSYTRDTLANYDCSEPPGFLTALSYYALVLVSCTGLSTLLGLTEFREASVFDLVTNEQQQQQKPPPLLTSSCNSQLRVEPFVLEYIREKQQQKKQRQQQPNEAEGGGGPSSSASTIGLRLKRRFEYKFRLVGLEVVMLHFESTAGTATTTDGDGNGNGGGAGAGTKKNSTSTTTYNTKATAPTPTAPTTKQLHLVEVYHFHHWILRDVVAPLVWRLAELYHRKCCCSVVCRRAPPRMRWWSSSKKKKRSE